MPTQVGTSKLGLGDLSLSLPMSMTCHLGPGALVLSLLTVQVHLRPSHAVPFLLLSPFHRGLGWSFRQTCGLHSVSERSVCLLSQGRGGLPCVEPGSWCVALWWWVPGLPVCRTWMGAICLQELSCSLAPGVLSNQPIGSRLAAFHFSKEAKRGAESENKENGL